MDEIKTPFSTLIFKDNPGKKALKTMANQAVEDFIETNDDFLKLADTIAKIETFIGEIRGNRNFIDCVLGDINRRGFKSSYQMDNGTKVEEIEGGTKYDYTASNDVTWDRLKAQRNAIDDLLKARETFLKTVPSKGMTITDEDTGETWTVFPPLKTSTTTYKITLPK